MRGVVIEEELVQLQKEVQKIYSEANVGEKP